MASLNRFFFIMMKKDGGALMRDKKYYLYVDGQERTFLLQSLVELKNELIQQGRYTDCVDELIFKMTKAPVKKVKVDRKSCGCVI